MLKAFYDKLRQMTEDSDDLFHKLIKERIGENFDTALEKSLKEAILSMPDLTSRISSLWSHLKPNSKIKTLGSYFMTYMYSPKDFIPEDEAHGLFGYLDDAYFVLAVFELLIDELVKNQTPVSAEDLKLKNIAMKHKAEIKAVISQEASQIQQIIGEALDGEDTTFKKLLAE